MSASEPCRQGNPSRPRVGWVSTTASADFTQPFWARADRRALWLAPPNPHQRSQAARYSRDGKFPLPHLKRCGKSIRHGGPMPTSDTLGQEKPIDNSPAEHPASPVVRPRSSRKTTIVVLAAVVGRTLAMPREAQVRWAGSPPRSPRAARVFFARRRAAGRRGPHEPRRSRPIGRTASVPQAASAAAASSSVHRARVLQVDIRHGCHVRGSRDRRPTWMGYTTPAEPDNPLRPLATSVARLTPRVAR